MVPLISPTDVSLSYTASVAAHASTITTLQTGPLVLKGISLTYDMDSTIGSNLPSLDIKLYDGSSEIIRVCHYFQEAQVGISNYAYTFPANRIRVDGDLGLGVRAGSAGGSYSNLAATKIYVLYQQG